MVGYALTVNTISLERLLAAVAVHVTVLEGSHARVIGLVVWKIKRYYTLVRSLSPLSESLSEPLSLSESLFRPIPIPIPSVVATIPLCDNFQCFEKSSALITVFFLDSATSTIIGGGDKKGTRLDSLKVELQVGLNAGYIRNIPSISSGRILSTTLMDGAPVPRIIIGSTTINRLHHTPTTFLHRTSVLDNHVNTIYANNNGDTL
jgi:hypothetical protein